MAGPVASSSKNTIRETKKHCDAVFFCLAETERFSRLRRSLAVPKIFYEAKASKNFDRCAEINSLHHPLGALVDFSPAGPGASSSKKYQKNKKTLQCSVLLFGGDREI